MNNWRDAYQRTIQEHRDFLRAQPNLLVRVDDREMRARDLSHRQIHDYAIRQAELATQRAINATRKAD